MEENKNKIAKLQSMLKNSKKQLCSVEEAVESLTQELVAKTQRIEELPGWAGFQEYPYPGTGCCRDQFV